MADEALEREKYTLLKDLRVEIGRDEETFCLCFWLFLVKSITFPVTVVQKVCLDATEDYPVLVINENRIAFFPLCCSLESQGSSEPSSSSETPHVSLELKFPLEKWVHIVCEVSSDVIRLHIDGEVVGEKFASFVPESDSGLDDIGKIALVSGSGVNNNQSYIYNLEILPTASSIKYHHAEDVPVQLSIDISSLSEIEVDDGGVWSIVGGKASYRRHFSLDVILIDACGEPVRKETEVIAFLVYLDNGAPVERTTEEEAPLLACYDGVEFASHDRPSKLLNGRASFKFKISQLSSKCQNRLFRIVFHIPQVKTYPFLEALSPPIRSFQRHRTPRVSLASTWRRSTSSVHPISPEGLDLDAMEVIQNSFLVTHLDSSSKRLKLGPDWVFQTSTSEPILKQSGEECNSHKVQNGVTTSSTIRPENSHKVQNAVTTSSTIRPENSSENISSSDSDNTKVKNSAPTPRSNSSTRNPISDITVFKYGMAGIIERSQLLKEIVNSASNEDIIEFSRQVSLYVGCTHHSYQIMMAKRLVEEGAKIWNSVSRNGNKVLWDSIVFVIEQQFMKIASCDSRSLSHQDFERLRRISGCKEYVSQENFEQMWFWLYPVAHTLSRNRISTLWSSSSPRWIEGFVTKEEAESSLRGPRGVQEPGTFVLRFPTSRSWPHPDAGSLVVTYIGRDFVIHHKLLSLDRVFSSAEKDEDAKSLMDMLLEDPELSRLGRIRSH